MPQIARFSTFLFIFGSALPVLAADIDAQSTIERVTLFNDRAQVTRVIRFESEAGAHRLIVSGLPQGLMRQSLQLLPGNASAGLTLGQVSLVNRPLEVASDDDIQLLRDRIEDLERQKTIQHDQISAEESKLAFIRGVSESLHKDQAGSIRRGMAQAQTLLEMMDLVRDQSLSALAEITAARAKIADFDERIDLWRRELEQLDGGALSEQVAAIDLDAQAALQGELELVYQVRGGSWRSVIDARLDTQNGELNLVQNAFVNQRTGEDWSDVELVLSTTQPIFGSLPELEPWVIDVLPDATFAESRSLEPLVRKLTATRGVSNDVATANVAMEAPMARPQAVSVVEGLNSSFIAASRVSVPSGAGEHQVSIGEWPQESTLLRKILPRVQAKAFVSAEFAFEGSSALPPSELRLFRDGGFVGTVQQDALVPGAPTQIEFGVDDRIEVSHRLDRDARESEGIITDYERTTRNFETIVTNRHDQPVSVVVLDQHPVPRDERIEVELTDRTSDPSRIDVEGRDGVVAWDLELDAGQEEFIRFGYSVVHPSDLEISHF